MAATGVMRPDRAFTEAIIASGGDSLKQCFQCATCSGVCDLSTEDNPFPRKEMHWAQWGLRDRLVADPDVWLCHQCGDCTARCPRGARPGDVLGAVRAEVVRHYAVPSFLARWTRDGRFLAVAFLLPAALLVAALLVREPAEAALGMAAGHEAFYAAFFPHWLLIAFFTFFTALAVGAAVVGLARFWRGMKAADVEAGRYAPVLGVGAALLAAARSILRHDRFARCTAEGSRRLSHLAVFYGFVGLLVVTTWAVLDLYVNPGLGIASRYPFNLLHPMKILGNVAGLALIFGAGRMLLNRYGSDAAAGTSFDLFFLWLLLAVGLTGMVTQGFRFAAGDAPGQGVTAAGYAVYFVHLVLVFQLLVFLPYTKFAHVLYRTAAMTYAEHTGRRTVARAVQPVVVTT